MSVLNPHQTDVLTELVSIAFGLTAAKLSEISGCRVVLDVPITSIHPMNALATELGPFVTAPAVSVHQVFSGPISGNAILLFNSGGAVELCNLFAEEQLRPQGLDCSTNEILTEIGNVLLGTCLGVFGNLLEVRVSFSIPLLHLDSLEHFLASLSIGGDKLQHAVVSAAPFHIREKGVDGRIVIALCVASLERLIQSVERWESSQAQLIVQDHIG
jgi:chemotaxis protein CheC